MYYNGCFFTNNPSQALSGKKRTSPVSNLKRRKPASFCPSGRMSLLPSADRRTVVCAFLLVLQPHSTLPSWHRSGQKLWHQRDAQPWQRPSRRNVPIKEWLSPPGGGNYEVLGHVVARSSTRLRLPQGGDKQHMSNLLLQELGVIARSFRARAILQRRVAVVAHSWN